MNEIQTVKAILSSYRHALIRTEAALDELYKLRKCRDQLTAYLTETPGVDKIPRSPVESAVARIERVERIIAEGVERLEATADRVRRIIESVEDEPSRDLLTLRYLDGLRWEEIAVRLCYTYRHVTRLHGRALRFAAEVIARERCP